MTAFAFTESELQSLLDRAVALGIERYEETQAKLGDRLAFSEAEAAALLGVERHVLRDLRLRGEVAATRINRRVFYQRKSLIHLLDKYETNDPLITSTTPCVGRGRR